MTRKSEPLLAEYIDLAAMGAAADEERPRAPVRVTGDAAGPASREQIQAERVLRDVADRLGAPDRGAA